MWQIVSNGRVLVSYGPVELSIIAEIDGQGVTDLAILGAETVPKILKELAPYQQELKQCYPQIELKEDYPDIVKRMYRSVAKIGDPTFTPMAAVAGSVAGTIADMIYEAGATKVIVNNGGDIAVRLQPGEMTKVGISPSIDSQHPTHYVTITGDSKIRGIASSGFGGRSFTKGFASVATVFSDDIGIADVAATLIGNHTFTQTPKITQVFAEEIYPDTDLKGEKITVEVGDISFDTKKIALKNGLLTAEKLRNQELILGAVVFVQGVYGMVPKKFAQALQNETFNIAFLK